MENIDSIDQMMSLSQAKDMLFLNQVVKDGFSFAKRIVPGENNEINRVNLELEDLTSAEIDQYFNPTTLDPGRTQAFTAYYGNEQKRRFSTKEYYDDSRAKKMDDKKKSVVVDDLAIKDIETAIPSTKTTNIASYLIHISYILRYMDAFFSFYNFENCAQDRWENFVSRKAVNILINGGKKYNGCRAKTRRKRKERTRTRKRRRRQQRQQRKTAREPVSMDEDTPPPPPPPPPPVTANVGRRSNYTPANKRKMPLVVFGSAMLGKDGVRIKGHRHGITDMIFKQLKHRESLGELCLVTIDVYFTSQVCNKCKTRNLKNVTDSNGKKLHAVLRCLTCNTLIWNRDVMASKNMWDISWSIWRGEGRPNAFKPLTQQQQQPGPSQQQQQQQPQ